MQGILADKLTCELYWREPVITAYPRYANVLAIIQQFSGGELWLLNHCIQLQINRGRYDGMNLDFCVGDMLNTVYRCPFLSFEALDIEEFTGGGNEGELIEKVIRYIDQGKYVYLPVDWFFIPAYQMYGKQHTAHDILVFGYDLENKEFMVADFFGHFKYQRAKCSFKDFLTACKDISELPCILDKVLLLKPCHRDIMFDAGNVKELLGDYIEAKNSNRRFLPVCRYMDFLNNDIFEFGVDVYEKLIGYLDHIAATKNTIHIRSYDILYEHKMVLLKLSTYMRDNGYLRNSADIVGKLDWIKSQCLVIRNVLLKYNLTGSLDAVERCVRLLHKVREKETEALKQWLESINEEPCLLKPEGQSVMSDARYEGEDRSTLGNWIGVYGDFGFDIFEESEIGEQLRVVYHGFNSKKWKEISIYDDPVYVRARDGKYSFAGCKYFVKEACMDVLILEDKHYMLSFYILAWWNFVRDFSIQILDGDSGSKLCEKRVIACNEGLYVNFIVSGHVKIVFMNHGLDLGVLSGVFFSAVRDEG